jgi:acetolactate synthase-1/2/3 large subunit
VVCILGSRLGDAATSGWTIPIGGTEATFQIDRDPRLIGRNYPVTLGVVGDATLALRTMLSFLPTDIHPVDRPLVRGIERTKPHFATSDEVPLKPARVLTALQAAFPDAFFTSDQGEHFVQAVHYMQVDAPDQFRAMLALASMGAGIGAAIGAREALPGRTVVGICGDGGFAMHAGEILTCVESGINVIFAVLNDGKWNMINHGFETVFGRSPAALPSHVADIAAVASGFGAIGVRIETPEDLEPSKLCALASRGLPVVLDIRIDSSFSLSARSRSASLKQSAMGITR